MTDSIWKTTGHKPPTKAEIEQRSKTPLRIGGKFTFCSVEYTVKEMTAEYIGTTYEQNGRKETRTFRYSPSVFQQLTGYTPITHPMYKNLPRDEAKSKPLEVGDEFDYNGKLYRLTEATDPIRAQDLTGSYPIGRVFGWSPEKFEAMTGYKLTQPEPKGTVAIGQEFDYNGARYRLSQTEPSIEAQDLTGPRPITREFTDWTPRTFLDRTGFALDLENKASAAEPPPAAPPPPPAAPPPDKDIRIIGRGDRFDFEKRMISLLRIENDEGRFCIVAHDKAVRGEERRLYWTPDEFEKQTGARLKPELQTLPPAPTPAKPKEIKIGDLFSFEGQRYRLSDVGETIGALLISGGPDTLNPAKMTPDQFLQRTGLWAIPPAPPEPKPAPRQIGIGEELVVMNQRVILSAAYTKGIAFTAADDPDKHYNAGWTPSEFTDRTRCIYTPELMASLKPKEIGIGDWFHHDGQSITLKAVYPDHITGTSRQWRIDHNMYWTAEQFAEKTGCVLKAQPAIEPPAPATPERKTRAAIIPHPSTWTRSTIIPVQPQPGAEPETDADPAAENPEPTELPKVKTDNATTQVLGAILDRDQKEVYFLSMAGYQSEVGSIWARGVANPNQKGKSGLWAPGWWGERALIGKPTRTIKTQLRGTGYQHWIAVAEKKNVIFIIDEDATTVKNKDVRAQMAEKHIPTFTVQLVNALNNMLQDCVHQSWGEAIFKAIDGNQDAYTRLECFGSALGAWKLRYDFGWSKLLDTMQADGRIKIPEYDLAA